MTMSTKEQICYTQQVLKEQAVARIGLEQMIKKYEKIRSVRRQPTSRQPSEVGLGLRRQPSSRQPSEVGQQRESNRVASKGSTATSGVAAQRKATQEAAAAGGWNPRVRHLEVMAAFTSDSVKDPPHPLFCEPKADFRMGSTSLNFLGLNPDYKKLKTMARFNSMNPKPPPYPRPQEIELDAKGKYMERQGPMSLGSMPSLDANERPLSAGIPLGARCYITPGEVLARSSSARVLREDAGRGRCSAAKSFLNQTLPGGEVDPYTLRRLEAPSDPNNNVQDLRRLLRYGVSHEGEGRFGYLKARLLKTPVEKAARPMITSQEIGWAMPVCGKDIKPRAPFLRH